MCIVGALTYYAALRSIGWWWLVFSSDYKDCTFAKELPIKTKYSYRDLWTMQWTDLHVIFDFNKRYIILW